MFPSIVGVVGVQLVCSVIVIATRGSVRASSIVGVVGVQLVGVVVVVTVGTSS